MQTPRLEVLKAKAFLTRTYTHTHPRPRTYNHPYRADGRKKKHFYFKENGSFLVRVKILFIRRVPSTIVKHVRWEWQWRKRRHFRSSARRFLLVQGGMLGPHRFLLRNYHLAHGRAPSDFHYWPPCHFRLISHFLCNLLPLFLLHTLFLRDSALRDTADCGEDIFFIIFVEQRAR